METKEILKACVVDGNIIKLPSIQLERKEYLSVKKELELIGGTWKGGTTQGFVYTDDPSDFLKEICDSEVGLKKKHQFFATPPELATKLVNLADLSEDDIILEPSAGQGAILQAIIDDIDHDCISYCENMPVNIKFLEKNFSFCGLESKDFMELNKNLLFNKIIANPPFTNNQDIDHVKHMYNHLKIGGRLVSVMSKHWQTSKNKKETNFRQWLGSVNAKMIEVPADTFKSSGTKIATVIVVITKY